MINPQDTLPIGHIQRPHGKQGQLLLAFDSPRKADWWEQADPEFLLLRLDNILVPWRVEDWQFRSDDTLILSLSGVRDEAHAAALTAAEAAILRTDLAAPDDDPGDLLTWHDLIGWTVLDEQGRPLGTIDDIDDSTPNTLFILNDGRLLPAHEDLITALDPDRHTLNMTLPEGL